MAAAGGVAGNFGFFVEDVFRFAKHEQPFFRQTELVVELMVQLFEALSAGEVEIAKNRTGLLDMGGIGGKAEVPAPFNEIQA